MRGTTNIIKVKHRLYYSLRWNCFLFDVDCTMCTNAFYAGIYIHAHTSAAHIELVFCSLPHSHALFAVFAPLPLLAASMADMLMYEHCRMCGILLISYTHIKIFLTCRLHFRLCVLLFVCLLLVCLFSISFAWRKPVFMASVHFFIKRPDKIVSVFLFLFLFGHFLILALALLFVEILIQSFILKHSTSYSINVVYLHTKGTRSSTNQSKKSCNKQQTVNCWNEE